MKRNGTIARGIECGAAHARARGRLALAALLLCAAVAPVASARQTGNPQRVAASSLAYGPHELVLGRTLAQWNLKWLRWEFSESQKTSPLFHPRPCRHEAVGDMWLLPGLAATDVTLTCTVPANTSLYVPTAGYIDWADAHTKIAQLVPMAHAAIPQAKIAYATVDGHKIDAHPYADETKLFAIKTEPGSLLGAAGTHVAAASTFNLILRPLPSGKHVIVTQIRVLTTGQKPFVIRTTFRVTVR
jgi:hypothetical protein